MRHTGDSIPKKGVIKLGEMVKVSKRQLILMVELAKDNPNLDVDMLIDLVQVNEEPKTRFLDDIFFDEKDDDLLKNNIRGGREWSINEENQLIDMYEEGKTVRELSEQLGRTEQAVRLRITKLSQDSRLKKVNPRAKTAWTKEEKRIVEKAIKDYKEPKEIPEVILSHLGQRFGRSPDSILTQAYILFKGKGE